ncbi:hypothetical protein [Phenylobacterium sp.]|uniref:hypothetical protein n=1 Tax=Phenylobacterium sp. TaxID=1871053 RepID=UPI00374D1FEC
MTSRSKLGVALCAMTLCLAGAAVADPIQVVSAGAEYAALHPRPVAEAGAASPHGAFHATMDRVFGPGRWRQTSGYRTPAQEDALRRQGAGAVARGRTSLHSVGGPEAPGAYDAVVDRVAPARAAARLRQAGVGFSRVVAEAAHGREGPHLHVELVGTRNRAAPAD